MYGGRSVIVIVRTDSMSFSENVHFSNRSESIVGSRNSGRTVIAIRESIPNTNDWRRFHAPEIGAASRNAHPTRQLARLASKRSRYNPLVMMIAAPASVLKLGIAAHTKKSIAITHASPRYSSGATVAAGARRNASV